MNLYQFIERILYYLVLVVGERLVKMLKIVEKLSGLYGSAIISTNHNYTYSAVLMREHTDRIYGAKRHKNN